MSVIMWYIPHSCWISIGMRARRAGSSINFSSSSPFNYLSQWLHTLAALMILPPCFCPIMTGLWLFQHFPGTGLWQSFYRLFLSPAAFCMASYVCRRSCLAFELISLPRTKREVDRMTCCWDIAIWIFQGSGWHHLGFLPTESTAIRYTDPPKNPTLELNMRWTGWLFPEIWVYGHM